MRPGWLVDFAGLLTIAFVVLRLSDAIEWPWPLVVCPVIIAVGLALLAGPYPPPRK